MSANRDVSRCPAVIYVFAMGDCPACEEYLPRFLSRLSAYAAAGTPFVVVGEHDAIRPGTVPVLVYDAAAEDPAVQDLADRFAVRATPATVVALRGPGTFKSEGSLGNYQVDQLLELVASEVRRHR